MKMKLSITALLLCLVCIPIVAAERTEFRPGGAANVAFNLRSLGAEVLLVGISGTDPAAVQLGSILSDYNIPHQILPDSTRRTTEKIRVIAGSQHIVRLDKESTVALPDQLAVKIVAQVSDAIVGSSGLVFQDYHKGTLSPQVIQQLCALAIDHKCPVFVDPKNDNIDDFRGATLIKPNLAEAEHITGYPLLKDDDFKIAGNELRKRLDVEAVLITRGPKGMDLFDNEGYHRIPTRAREVSDVCGAGDTVISTYSLAYVTGATPLEAAELANYAAGSVVEEIGVVPVTPQKLEGIIRHHAEL